MKIAFICTLYAPNEIGGAEKAMRLIAEEAVARGHQAVVITLSPQGKRSRDCINGVVVHYVPLANVFWPHAAASERPAWKRAVWHLIDAYNPVMGARVRRILADEKPDVVEANNLQGFSVAVWSAARDLGIPVVQVLHDYYLGCPNSTMSKAGHSCASQCRGCSLYTQPRKRLSSIPAVVSSVSRRLLERLESSSLFCDVPSRTVVATAFDAGVEPRARADKPAHAVLTLGFIGRLEQIKGIEVLLAAMNELQNAPVKLLVAGKGDPDYVEALRARFGSSNVEYLGFTAPEAFFARIDLLVAPSVWEEPLGRVIFEGFAYGVPAIVTRRGGMPEIVDEGITGFVVDAESPAAIVRLVRRLIEEGLPAGRLAVACRARSTEFGIDRIFAAHLANWQRAVNTRGQLAAYRSALPGGKELA